MKRLFTLEMKVVVLLSAFISTLGQWGYAEDLHGAFAPKFNLTNLNGKNGFAINGIAKGEGWGYVGGIGDIDGDGIDDIIVCGPWAKSSTGQCYVIFGSREPWLPIIRLNSLDRNSGFAINGVHPGDLLGLAVSRAGDVNGDGIADIILGAPALFFGGVGQSYVLFGSKNPSPVSVDLANLNGTNGFVIDGINGTRRMGFSVSGAGDVNGDGIDDIIVGAPVGVKNIGQSYVIFGKESWPGYFNLDTLDGANGFAIDGIGGQMGSSVSGAGDVNGDGIADILIGALGVNDEAGQSYVVFGNKQRWPSVINLGDLNGSNGFAIDGINQSDTSGHSVSGAGDVNGDGIDDILIGAPLANNVTGQSYVVFGSRAARPATFKLASLNGKNGFIMNGFNPGDWSGFSVRGASDVNGDGIDDIIIGAPEAANWRGQTYIVFGSKKPWPAVIKLAALDGKNGCAMTGIGGRDWSGHFVSGAGDVNGDGIDDILIGSGNANSGTGQSYLVFGEKE